MGDIRKSPTIRKTSEIEMANEAANAAAVKLKAVLDRRSTDYKGALSAVKDINRYIRLLNQQVRAIRLSVGASRQLSKSHVRRRKGGN